MDPIATEFLGYGVLKHVDKFLAAHGPQGIVSTPTNIRICDNVTCSNCVLGTFVQCPIGYLPLHYREYLVQRYPECFI